MILIDSVEKQQIKLLAKTLRIPSFTKYDSILRQNDSTLTYEKLILLLMKQELAAREINRHTRLMRAAKFPYVKTLSEYDNTRLHHIQPAYVNELSGCDYISKRENIIMLGNPGSGKTHLSIALGIKACEAGYHVKFMTAARLVNEMTEAKDSRNLLKLERALTKVDLLIIDELSYVRFNRAQSELLFQIISERSERGSIITSSNLEFSKWVDLFENEMTLSALIDRLTFKSHILNLNTKDNLGRSSLKTK